MNKIIETKCVNCDNYYLKLEKKNTSGKGIANAKVRAWNTITCSRKCSKEFSFLPFKRRKELKKQNQK